MKNRKKPEVIWMSQAQAISPLVLAFVTGGFKTFGVVLKIGYDAIALGRPTK